LSDVRKRPHKREETSESTCFENWEKNRWISWRVEGRGEKKKGDGEKIRMPAGVWRPPNGKEKGRSLVREKLQFVYNEVISLEGGIGRWQGIGSIKKG